MKQEKSAALFEKAKKYYGSTNLKKIIENIILTAQQVPPGSPRGFAGAQMQTKTIPVGILDRMRFLGWLERI